MRHIFIILSLSITVSSYAQLRFDYEYTKLDTAELLGTYTLTYMQDTTNPDFKRTVDVLLFLGHDISLFISKEFYSFDTIMKRITNDSQFRQFILDPNKPFPRIRYKIYKNLPSGKQTFIGHVIGGSYKFEEDLDLFNWQLQGDTATISGYKTQKATCDFGGRSWVAWFSPEIPYSDGPYKFNGLPGLIVKIGDTREHYVFELISIEKPEKETIIEMKEKDYFVTTKQGFFKAKDAFKDDIINRAKEAGLSSKDQQTAAKNMAKRNNPIELIRK